MVANKFAATVSAALLAAACVPMYAFAEDTADSSSQQQSQQQSQQEQGTQNDAAGSQSDDAGKSEESVADKAAKASFKKIEALKDAGISIAIGSDTMKQPLDSGKQSQTRFVEADMTASQIESAKVSIDSLPSDWKAEQYATEKFSGPYKDKFGSIEAAAGQVFKFYCTNGTDETVFDIAVIAPGKATIDSAAGVDGNVFDLLKDGVVEFGEGKVATGQYAFSSETPFEMQQEFEVGVIGSRAATRSFMASEGDIVILKSVPDNISVSIKSGPVSSEISTDSTTSMEETEGQTMELGKQYKVGDDGLELKPDELLFVEAMSTDGKPMTDTFPIIDIVKSSKSDSAATAEFSDRDKLSFTFNGGSVWYKRTGDVQYSTVASGAGDEGWTDDTVEAPSVAAAANSNTSTTTNTTGESVSAPTVAGSPTSTSPLSSTGDQVPVAVVIGAVLAGIAAVAGIVFAIIKRRRS